MATNKISGILEFHKKLLDFVDADVKQTIQNQVKTQLGSFKIICLVLFTKSTKTFRAIQHLCGKGIGYGEDAMILTRSLLENLINLAYIANPQQEEERERRAKLFANWLIIDLKRKIDGLPSNDPLKPQLEEHFKNWQSIGVDYGKINELHQDECQKLRATGKQPNKRYWSCLSIKGRAEEVGLLPAYNGIYWICSKIAHPDPGVTNFYVNEMPDRNSIIYDTPNPTLIEETLAFSFDYYIRMVGLINNIFNLRLDGKINGMKNNFIK